jgi:hypothetical protein
MVYSYEMILGVSMKMNKDTHSLNEETLTKINKIKKSLGIPINEIIKKTTIVKKEGDISKAIKLLNKISQANYDKLKVELFELIEPIVEITDIYKITQTIFNIASSNMFYSVLFSKLYTELISKNREFYNVTQEHFDTYLNDLNKIEYVSPSTDYDGYCIYTKKMDKMKSLLTFFINLMKSNNFNIDNIIELCVVLLTKVKDTIRNVECRDKNEEFFNCIHIIIKECNDFLSFHYHLETIHKLTTEIKNLTTDNPELSIKIKFKCEDILEMLK